MFVSRPLLSTSLALLVAAAAPGVRGAQPVEPESLPLLAAAPIDAPVPSPDLTEPPAKSPSVTINLIHRMVKKGLLTQEEADELIKGAEDDAAEVRAQIASARNSASQAVAAAQAAQAAAQQSAGPELPPLTDDTVRVTYLPENVKAQMRDEIRADVLAQAKAEGWAAPHLLPEWTTRIKLFGDIRFRAEGLLFPGGNDNTGAFPNFNSINTGAPFDVAGTVFSPQLNVDKDRFRFRIRARFGLEADLGFGFSAGFRIGTGENDSPVTENQTLGVANGGQGGNFSKYSIWLDRAFLKYEAGGVPEKDFTFTLGRFDNPFFGTTVLWANDLGFDGAVLSGRYKVAKGLTPFLTMGAFPVFNTDINFATNQPSKFSSTDKYLFAAQLGTTWKPHQDFNFKVAVAYYHFQGVEGRLSKPFVPLTSSDQGNTDDTRPAFAQNGNTYRPLRNIVPDALNNFGTTNQFQYFGLASQFHDLALTGRLDYNHWEPFQISLLGEYVKNVAFDRGAIDPIAVNNISANTASGRAGHFAGGPSAWILGIVVGNAVLDHPWAWNAGLNYRYVESDSVIDGFNDSDFGAPLTGTNLKGFTLFGNVALTPRVSVGLRYYSADAIAGPTYRSNVLQLDFLGTF